MEMAEGKSPGPFATSMGEIRHNRHGNHYEALSQGLAALSPLR